MNDRILELAKQAGLKFSSETAMSPVELKFAELIVQQCADKVFDIFDALPDVSVSDLQYYIRDRIKEHFGVEE
jgi:hypothetical protein